MKEEMKEETEEKSQIPTRQDDGWYAFYQYNVGKPIPNQQKYADCYTEK